VRLCNFQEFEISGFLHDEVIIQETGDEKPNNPFHISSPLSAPNAKDEPRL
jgi:hypothetical protein